MAVSPAFAEQLLEEVNELKWISWADGQVSLYKKNYLDAGTRLLGFSDKETAIQYLEWAANLIRVQF